MQRFSVNFSDRAYDVIRELSERLGAPKAVVVRDAISLYYWVATEMGHGSKLLIQRDGTVTEVVIPSLEAAGASTNSALSPSRPAVAR